MSKLKSILKQTKQKQKDSGKKHKRAKIVDAQNDSEDNDLGGDMNLEIQNHAKAESDSDSVVELKNADSDSEYPFENKTKKIGYGQEQKGGLAALLQENMPTNDEAAWEDKNDNDISIDIMNNTRTKKLQEEHGEDTITGSEYSRRLRKFQEKVSQNNKNELYKWAYQEGAEEEEKDSDNMLLSLLKTNTKITSSTNFSLPQKLLDYTRLAHVNEKDVHSSVVNAVDFHPTNNLMLSAGLDKRLKLYNVNHTKSIRVQSIFTKDLPIYSASFIQNGKEILLSGARKHFYYYDLGKNELMKVSHIFGNQDEKDLKKCVTSPMSPYFAFLGKHNFKSAMVMSTQTKQLLFDLNISSGRIQDGSFADNYFYAVDSSGSIQQFDLRTRTCVTTLSDSGSYNTTCVTVSNSGKYLATGTYAGIVNIYDLHGNNTLVEGQKPLKSISNLTTSINLVEFNHNDEILAIGSKWKKNGLRLVHTDSLTVFENFPSFKNNVKYPFS